LAVHASAGEVYAWDGTEEVTKRAGAVEEDRVDGEGLARTVGQRTRHDRRSEGREQRRHRVLHRRRVPPCRRVPPRRRVTSRRVGLRRQRGGEKGEGDQPRPNQAPARLSRNSVNNRTPTAVGPLAWPTPSPSRYAVPAISRWTHGKLSTNSRRNQAPAITPAARPPEFLTSATSDLSSSR